jgi:hypothetical protein
MTCQRICLHRRSEQVPASPGRSQTFTRCWMKVENSQLHANDSTCRRGPSYPVLSRHRPGDQSAADHLQDRGLTLAPAATSVTYNTTAVTGEAKLAVTAFASLGSRLMFANGRELHRRRRSTLVGRPQKNIYARSIVHPRRSAREREREREEVIY